MTPAAYRDTLTDAHVAGSLTQRKSRNKLSELVITAGEDENGDISREAEAARELVTRQIDGIANRRGIRNIVNEILDAPFFGATYLELFWNRLPTSDEKPDGEIVLENIIGKPFEWFGYDRAGVLMIKERLETSFNLRPIPQNRIMAVVNDGSYRNPYGDRAVKRVYWPYQFKKGGFRFWTEFIEKYGMPFLFGRLDGAKSDDDLADFHEDLVEMVRNGVITIKDEGSGTDRIDVIETKSRASSSDAYKQYKDAMNIEISKAVMGETLTIENSESGSQAATRIHKEVLEDLQDQDRAMTEETFDKIFATMTRLNFGPDVPSPVSQLKNPKELNKDIAERDSILYKDIGVRFSKNYIANTYKIADEDFELVAPPEGIVDDEGGPGPGAAADKGKQGKQGDKGGKGEAGTAPEDTESGDKGTQFAESDFPIQDSLDAYMDKRLTAIQGLTKPMTQAIKKAIRDSQSYDDLFAKMSTLGNEFNNPLFAAAFGEILSVFEVVGEYAAEKDAQ